MNEERAYMAREAFYGSRPCLDAAIIKHWKGQQAAGDMVECHGFAMNEYLRLAAELPEYVWLEAEVLGDPVLDRVTVNVRTPQDFRRLSYYTLCRLQEKTHYAHPIEGLPVAIRRGEFQGKLTLDSLGNYVAFE